MLSTKSRNEDSITYQTYEDKEIKFDTANLLTRFRNGEKILASIGEIEDSKGNPGDIGTLILTNLRIIWQSLTHKKFNLSIGYSRIVTLSTRAVFSRTRGTAQALYIIASGRKSRFEFLFSDVSGQNKASAGFACVYEIHQIYQKTVLYRELKLRCAILHCRKLILLPEEQIYTSMSGVWNLSSDQGNLGSFIITNVRIVWFADVNEHFNISLPYMQIASIKIRDSKYGDALVIQTADTGGGYTLGFRIDPPEKLNDVYKELVSLFAIYSETPNFGVHYEQRTVKEIDKQPDPTVNDNKSKDNPSQEMEESQDENANIKLTAYLAEGYVSNAPTREPIYSKELGFAMERIRDGYKLSDLWQVEIMAANAGTA